MAYCCVTPRSFCQEGEEEYKLKKLKDIATNSSGHLIEGDFWDGDIKVFHSRGTFLSLFSVPYDDADKLLYIADVAIDTNDNIYVLIRLQKPEEERCECLVCKFDNTSDH